jgi:hypothetical protein
MVVLSQAGPSADASVYAPRYTGATRASLSDAQDLSASSPHRVSGLPPGRTRAGRSSKVAPVVRRWLRCSTGCSAWPLWEMLTPKSTGSSDASLRSQTILKVFTSVGGEHRMSFPVVVW